MSRAWLFAVLAVAAALSLSGCLKPRITLFPDPTEPLKEYTLQGKETPKVLVVSVRGFISDAPKDFPFYRRPSMVQEIVSELKRAEKDKDIKAVVLKIDSPGGSITASDILYNEIVGYKARSGAKVVAAMMDYSTSGAYYIALPADLVMAHPTTVTGSIGVLFLRPKITGLMGKIGLDIEVDKSGKNKDMGSPFRQTTEEEHRIIQGLIDELGGRFVSLVARHRRLNEEALADIATARIYLANEALRLGLVDKIGYLDDALREAKRLAALPEDAKVVVYRRSEVPDDNIYNSATGKSGGAGINLIELGLADSLASLHSGFYYVWLPGSMD